MVNNQNKGRNKTSTHSFHSNNRWNIFWHLLRTVREHGNPGRVQLIQMTIKHIKTVVTHLGLNNGVLGVPIRTSWGRTYSVSWRRVWQGWTGCSSVPIHFFQFRLSQPETKMRSYTLKNRKGVFSFLTVAIRYVIQTLAIFSFTSKTLI